MVASSPSLLAAAERNPFTAMWLLGSAHRDAT